MQMEVVSGEILERVAEAEDMEPSELEKPLYHVVDPDSLDTIFESVQSGPTRDTGQIEFEYYGYQVIATAEGEVSLSELD